MKRVHLFTELWVTGLWRYDPLQLHYHFVSTKKLLELQILECIETSDSCNFLIHKWLIWKCQCTYCETLWNPVVLVSHSWALAYSTGTVCDMLAKFCDRDSKNCWQWANYLKNHILPRLWQGLQIRQVKTCYAAITGGHGPYLACGPYVAQCIPPFWTILRIKFLPIYAQPFHKKLTLSVMHFILFSKP